MSNPNAGKHTLSGATETSDGIIPHIQIGDLHCPVMLEIKPTKNGGYIVECDENGLPIPFRRAGRLVYALPGGRSFVAAAEKDEQV